MRRYIGFVMLLVGLVAVWDAMFGATKTDNPQVIGLLVLLLVIPGAILARKQKPHR